MDTLVTKRGRLCRNHRHREQIITLVPNRPLLMYSLPVRLRRR